MSARKPIRRTETQKTHEPSNPKVITKRADEHSKVLNKENVHESDSEQEQFVESAPEDNEKFDETCEPENLDFVVEKSLSVPPTPQRQKQPSLVQSKLPDAVIRHSARGSCVPCIPERSKQPSPVRSKHVDGTIPNSGGRSSLVILICVLTTLASMAFALVFRNNNNITCSYDALKKEYPKQEEKVWSTLRVGIESILNKRDLKPATYLFVHHGGDHVYKMIQHIASHSASCFSKNMRPVEMNNNDFSDNTNDYGVIIEKYKNKIKEGKVILIVNLNEIPVKAARALHFICDTHSPIARDVVIFLTLVIPHSEQGSVASITYDTLRELWDAELNDSELDPLITRVTDQVIALKS